MTNEAKSKFFSRLVTVTMSAVAFAAIASVIGAGEASLFAETAR